MSTIYMKVEGIDGNVTAKGHEKWIEIFGFGYGLARGITSTNPGRQSNREAGVPSFSEITVSKLVDETSPKFFLESCIGVAKKIEVHFCQTGDNPRNFVEFVLTNVLISRYNFNGPSGNAHPTETLTLNYTKIETKYTPYNDKHGVGTPIPAGYDLVTATKV